VWRAITLLCLIILLSSGCTLGSANVRRDINGEPRSLAVTMVSGFFDGLVDAAFSAIFGTDDDEDGISDHELERKGIERGSDRYNRLVAEEANIADLQENVDRMEWEQRSPLEAMPQKSDWYD
jgi:hypothetical protein